MSFSFRKGALVVLCSGLWACEGERAEPTPDLKADFSFEFSGRGMQSPSALSASGENVFMAGTFQEELLVAPHRLEGAGGLDTFVFASRSENLAWTTAIQGTGDDAILSIESHADGVTLLGYASRDAVITTSFADGTREASLRLPADATAVEHVAQPLLVDLDWEGRVRSIAHFTGSGYNSFTASARPESGDLFAGGEVSGNLQVGALEIAGFARAFVSKFTTGTAQWTVPLLGDGEAFVSELVSVHDGVLVTGNFTGTLVAGAYTLTASNALTQTPYLVRVSNAGEVLFASSVLAEEIEKHEHSASAPAGHAHHSSHAGHGAHAEHATYEVSEPRVLALDGGHALIATSYGSTFGMHGGDFEASSNGKLAVVSVDARGRAVRSDFAAGNATIAAHLELVRRGAGVHLIGSWSGALEIAHESARSEPGRSMFVLNWSEQEGLHGARKFSLDQQSLTANAAVTHDTWLWSAARTVHTETAEQQMLLTRFALPDP